MPAAIPLIVGAAVTAGLTGVVIGGFVITATVAGIIGGLASLATSMLLNKKPKAPDLSAFLDQAGAGRTQQVRQPTAARSIGYGQYKTSGPIMMIHTANDDDGRTNGYIYLVHALVATKIKAIRDTYFNDDLATESQFTGFYRVNKHLGDPAQTADSDLVSEIPTAWTTEHRGRGIAYTATRLKWDATAFSSGVPNIAFIVDGVDSIYDPRTEATAFTNNAALCIADWLTKPYGQGLPWERLDEDSVIEAANICDERVRVKPYDASFTADDATDILALAEGSRVYDWGDGIRVLGTVGSPAGTLPTGLSADTTYYVIPILHNQIKLATTVANAFAGTAIDLISDGSGSLTVRSWDEARYKLNGSFTLDTEKGEVLDQLRTAMAGYVFPRGGKWFVHAGAAPTPSFELTADDLAGDLQVAPKRSMRDRFNGIRGVFVNPDANWQPDDSPVLVPTAALLLEDDGEELYGDVRNSFVTSRRQMARLMKIELERNRRELTVQALFNFAALKIAPLDTGTMTISRYFTDQEFQVMDWTLDQEGIGLALLEHGPEIYDWDHETDEPDETPRQSVVLPDPTAAGAVAELRIDVTPTVVPPWGPYDYVLEWDPVSSIYLAGYQLAYSPIDADTWANIGSPVTSTSYNTFIVDGPYDFRIQVVNTNGSTSAWTYNYAPDPPGSPTYTGAAITWTSGAGAEDVQLFDNTDTLIATVPSADESYTGGAADWRVRSVNAEGNVGVLVDVT